MNKTLIIWNDGSISEMFNASPEPSLKVEETWIHNLVMRLEESRTPLLTVVVDTTSAEDLSAREPLAKVFDDGNFGPWTRVTRRKS